MTAPTGRPKGRPQSTVSIFEEEAMERIAIGHELVSRDPAERQCIEWVRAATRQMRAMFEPESAGYVLAEKSLRQLDAWCTYDDSENARHAQLAAPVQVEMVPA